MIRWLLLYLECAIEDVSFFIKASDEEKFLLFQLGEIKGK